MDQGERESLYQQLIMDRARAPLHAGAVEPADAAADGSNPFCGDRTHVTVALSPDGHTDRVMHQTRGCAICAASADLMAESVEGLDKAAISSLFGRFDAMLHHGVVSGSADLSSGNLGVLRAFENLHEYRSRIRCATLPWSALLDALKNERAA